MPDGDGQAGRSAGSRVRALFQTELTLVITCWVLAGAALLAWLLGASFPLVITLGTIGACCAPAALFVSWRMKRLYRDADAGIEQRRERLKEREERLRQLERLVAELQARSGAAADAAKQTQSLKKAQKIPCAVGFANLGGEVWREMAERDAAELGPLFERSRMVAGHVAVAEILFVYAAILEDGALEGTSGAGLRQIVDLTGAKLVILASPNPAERVHSAASLPGQGEGRAANLVFTIDRNGDAFPAFFRDLFALMRDCGDMPAAWAQLEDRLAASGQGDAPQVLLIAEGETAA